MEVTIKKQIKEVRDYQDMLEERERELEKKEQRVKKEL